MLADAPAGIGFVGVLLERGAALGFELLLDAGIGAVALEGDLVFAGGFAGGAQVILVAGVAVADLGEFHARPLAIGIGEAELPDARSPVSRTMR